MRIVSVNVGRPRLVRWRGGTVSTGIFKDPVAGPVRVEPLNLDGDRQADLTVHGGRTKAVYAYAVEDYAAFAGDLGPATFGENLTTEGLDHAALCLGDLLRAGTADLLVTEPRMPCFKLGIRMGDPRFVKTFLDAGRWGTYFAVITPGEVAAGDAVEVLSRHPEAYPVAALGAIHQGGWRDVEAMRFALTREALPPTWRGHLEFALAKLARRG
jgi:MOSC domain-containing protein YiiM